MDDLSGKAAYGTATSFFEKNTFSILLVFLTLLLAALVRANLHLVQGSPPSNYSYTLYETLVSDPGEAFCNSHPDLKTREKDCNDLSEPVCREAGCCVWADASTGHSACVAGDRHGPVYLSDPHSEVMYDITKYVHKAKTYSNVKASN